jgi:8-oxo-dGTP pyrophosphatase MutT (NUDIX family)
MYKVFINDKPLFFLNNLESYTLTQGSGVVEFSELETMEDLMDFHEDNLHTYVIGDQDEWKTFCSCFENIEAAGGLVENGEDRFLFILRNDKWDLPKGKLEIGESKEEGAVREVEEECGIKCPVITSHLLDTYHTYFHKGNWVLKRTYWYNMKYSGNDKLVPQIEEGITQVEWMTEDAWHQVMTNTYGSIQDVLEEYMKAEN